MTRFADMLRSGETPTHIYAEGVTGFNLNLNGEATNIVDPQLTGKPKSRSWGTFLHSWAPYVRYILLAVSTLALIAYAIRKLTPISLTDMDPNLVNLGEGNANEALPTLVVKPTLGPTLPNVLRLDTGLCSAVAVPAEPAAVEVPEESEEYKSLVEFTKKVYEEIKNLIPAFFRSEVKYIDLNGHEVTSVVGEFNPPDELKPRFLREILNARRELQYSASADSAEELTRYILERGVLKNWEATQKELNSPDPEVRLEAKYEAIHDQRYAEALEKNFLEVDLMQHLTNTDEGNYLLSGYNKFMSGYNSLLESLGMASIPEEPRTEIERRSSISA